jgi:hypothetical protein
MARSLKTACLIAFLTGSVTCSAVQQDGKVPKLVGRWDLTMQGASGKKFPSWLEVRLSGYRTLVGSYVGQFGSARPVAKIEVSGKSFQFTIPPQWENRRDDVHVEGTFEGDSLRGTTTDNDGRPVTFAGQRAPTLKRQKPPRWGEPTNLFNGQDLSGWKPQHADVENGWVVRSGLLVNAKPGNNLMTERKFTDFQLHAEYRFPPGSNSGIYLRGRYEVQIEDNFGDDPDSHKIGGIYGFLTPRINTARKAGDWQEMEITLVGRVVTVVFNGECIIDRQTIPGITGGALDSDEGAPGPILLQGDHGPIDFRKLTITPAVSPE